MTLKMTEEDYTILDITDYDYYHNGINIGKDELMVGSAMLSYGKEWPAFLEVNSKQYKYDGLTAMPDCFCGTFFSTALYRKV